MSAASDQITEYLSIGGFFNPEMMNQLQHRAVRDTLIKARDDIQRLERENAALRVRLDAASKHSALAVTLLAQAQVELVETRHNLNKPKEVQL